MIDHEQSLHIPGSPEVILRRPSLSDLKLNIEIFPNYFELTPSNSLSEVDFSNIEILDSESLSLVQVKEVFEVHEHPFAEIERKEKENLARLFNRPAPKEFLLENYQQGNQDKIPYLDISENQVLSQYCLPSEDYGVPVCSYVKQGRYVIIGTSEGVLKVFQEDFIQENKPKYLRKKGYGAVITIDVSLKNQTLISGYENGHIVIWSLKNFEEINTIKDFKQGSLICLKFYNEKENSVLISQANGTLWGYKIEKTLLKYKIEKKKLLPLNNKIEGRQFFGDQDFPVDLPEGYFDIKIKEMGKRPLIALASMKEVLVVQTEPVFEILFQYERPNNISHSIVPCISWEKRHELISDLKQRLVFSWGRDIYFLQIHSNDSKDNSFSIGDIQIIQHYKAARNVLFLDWISPNRLLTFDQQRTFKLILIGDLLLNNYGPNQEEESSDLQIEEYSVNFEANIQYQIFIDQEKYNFQKGVRHYTNTIVTDGLGQAFIMRNDKIFILTNLEWKKHIQDLVKGVKWNEALLFCVSLYKGNNDKFIDLVIDIEENSENDFKKRKESIQIFAGKLAYDFLQYIRKLETNEEMKCLMATLIEFIILTDNPKLLYNALVNLNADKDFYQAFLEELEPFIIAKKIPFLTVEAWNEISNYYIAKDKIDMIQVLVMNYSACHKDSSIRLCLKYNILSPLMDICSLGENSEAHGVLIPISASLNLYIEALEMNLEESYQHGIKFLWLLDMALNTEIFSKKDNKEKISARTLNDIVLLIFSEGNMELMLNSEPYIAFEILEKLFKPGFSKLLSQNKEELLRNLELNNTDKINHNAEIEEFQEYCEDKIQGFMLFIIYHCSRMKEKYENLIYYWFARINVNLQVNLPPHLIIETLTYLLKNPYKSSLWDLQVQEEDWKERKRERERRNKEERIRLLLGILKNHNDLIDEELLAIAHTTDLVDIRTYLLCLTGEFNEVFELYLDKKETVTSEKMKIFNWLHESIPFLQENCLQMLNRLNQVLVSRLKDLIALDLDETRKIIILQDGSISNEIVQELETTPSLQLEYLEVILEKQNKRKIEEEFLVLYINLLCQFNPKKAVEEIKTQDYPLEECLSVFKEYNIKEAMVFIYIKTGNSMQALKIETELFKDKFQSKLWKIIKTETFGSDSLRKKFESIWNICQTINKKDLSTNEELWLFAFNKLLEYYYSEFTGGRHGSQSPKIKELLKQKSQYQILEELYVDELNRFIKETSKNVPLKHILKIMNAYNGLDLKKFQKGLFGVLDVHSFEMTALENTNKLYAKDNYDNTRLLHTYTAVGMRVDKPRISEKVKEQGQKVMMYNCGHAFKKYNFEEFYCELCVNEEDFQVQRLFDSKNNQSSLTKKDLNQKKGKENRNLERDDKVNLKYQNNLTRFDEWKESSSSEWEFEKCEYFSKI